MAIKVGPTSTAVIDHGTGHLVGEAFTVLQWTFPFVNDTGNVWWQAASASRHNVARSLADDYSGQVAYSSTAAQFVTIDVNRPMFRWKFTAMKHAAATGGPRFYHGDLSTPAVEARYTTRLQGVGTFVTSTGSFLVGNSAAGTFVFPAANYGLMVFDRALSLTEIRLQQFSSQPMLGLKIWSPYDGALGVQRDLSGNGNVGTPSAGCAPFPNPVFTSRKVQPWMFEVVAAGMRVNALSGRGGGAARALMMRA